jgi:hypothetical protein
MFCFWIFSLRLDLSFVVQVTSDDFLQSHDIFLRCDGLKLTIIGPWSCILKLSKKVAVVNLFQLFFVSKLRRLISFQFTFCLFLSKRVMITRRITLFW